MGDFNSHSPSWGYDDLDHKGDEVEDWIITHNMVLINKADDPSTPELGQQRSSCPDLAIATDDVAKITSREVDKQLGGSDHKPIFLTIERQKHHQKSTKVQAGTSRKPTGKFLRN